MQRRIIQTDDGSHTLKVDALNEHYHSTFGAVAESRHVFIEAGLHKKLEEKPDELTILEIGFGTGLNALLTVLDPAVGGKKINYFGVEAYPLEESLWTELNYPDVIGDERACEIYNTIHKCEWGSEQEISTGFMLIKVQQTFQEYQHRGTSLDLIYFDAFGPDVQAELWTEDIFRKIANFTSKDGLLVTYSCKGSVKRALKAAGFVLEKIPGPKGKREMIRAKKF